MALIVIPNTETWKVQRRAFRQLLDRVMPQLSSDEDRETIRDALAYDGLQFRLLPPTQAKRLAATIAGWRTSCVWISKWRIQPTNGTNYSVRN
jgi:hypothetical protein